MKTTLPPDLVRLQTSVDIPYYRQLYLHLRGAIDDGLLAAGDRIPSARALAGELGLARGTIDSAYSLLAAEGYIVARGQAGTIVAHAAPAPPPVLPSMPSAPPPALRAFQMGAPALDAFPRKIWARLAAHQARAAQGADLFYPPAAGLMSLRLEIARYLHLSRGISCVPEQVFVTAGYRAGLQLLARALLQPGDRVWVEDPGYAPAASLLRGTGMQLVGVPVDDQGLQVAHGLALAPKARAALVTPAHHSPLCVTLAPQRRLALLDWAQHQQSWIIEDDYDGEYRYAGRPLPALKSLDRHHRVVYAGSFSKVLFPALRLAYLVVPGSEVARFEQAARELTDGTPVLMQQTVAAFMAQGHFARHIQRMRRLYAQRRALVGNVLGEMLGQALQVQDTPGGMHLLVRLNGRRSDRLLAQRLREAGMFACALSDCTLDGRTAVPPTVMLGFTNIASRDQAQQLAGRILALL